MFCMKCHNDLTDCTCPDLQERLSRASEGGHFIYRMCRKCGLHYSKCKCKNPEWITSDEQEKRKN